MADNFVSNPYAYFNARNQGKPVALGEIFVGIPGLDPTIVANQKQVAAKQENGTKVNITQPISTNSGGYPVFNGAPVVLLVDGNHAIRVNDSGGNLALEQSNVNDGVPLTQESGQQSIDNIVDLKAFEPLVDGQQIELLGHTVAGIGGGPFYFDASDTTSADNNGTVIVTPGGKRWKRPEKAYVMVTWFGAVHNGTTDDAPAIQAAENYSFPLSKQLLFPNGIYRTNSTISRGQHSWWEGEQSVDTGSEIFFFGADGTNAVEAIGGTGNGISRCFTREMRILDKRTLPTSGDGLHLSNFDNRVNVIGCFIGNFPGAQINVTAPVGTANDSTMIDDCWVVANVAGGSGINIERSSNIVQIRNIKCDTGVASPCINIDNVANELTVIDISNIKHEANNANSPTIKLGTNHGNVYAQNIVQNNAGGTASNIIEVTNSTAARLILTNISGSLHSTWGSGPQLVSILAPFAHAIAGVRLDNAFIGTGGRIVRDLAGNGAPEGSVFGNVGDTFRDPASSNTFYIKSSGAGTNTGWFLVPKTLGSVTQVEDLPSIAALGTVTFDVPFVGSLVGDAVSVGFGGSGAFLMYTAQVVNNGNVRVVVFNPTAGALDPTSQTFTIRINR